MQRALYVGVLHCCLVRRPMQSHQATPTASQVFQDQHEVVPCLQNSVALDDVSVVQQRYEAGLILKDAPGLHADAAATTHVHHLQRNDCSFSLVAGLEDFRIAWR